MKTAVRQWGDECGHLIMQRLGELRAAETLETMRSSDPVPRKGDGGLDWSGVTAIVILEVDDPHD